MDAASFKAKEGKMVCFDEEGRCRVDKQSHDG